MWLPHMKEMVTEDPGPWGEEALLARSGAPLSPLQGLWVKEACKWGEENSTLRKLCLEVKGIGDRGKSITKRSKPL